MPCDIIIPVFNQKKYTESCIVSIGKNTRQGYRIIIVDDKSSEPDAVKFLGGIKDENIKIIRNTENLGWVKSVNRGIKESSAEYVCIMNNDTLVTDGWLSEMIAVAEKAPDIGLVNPEWEKPDKAAIDDYAQSLTKYRGQFIETDWVRGFCFLVKRQAINKIGGLDEAYSPGYYDDCDYSVRALRAGFRPVLAKGAYVYHYRNGTHESVLKKEGMNSLLGKHKELFYKRWGRPLRLVFIFTKKIADGKAVEDMLFSLARQQHRLYIWVANKDIPQIEHTNVEVRILSKALFCIFAGVNVFNNLWRNKSKRYDVIFTDDRWLFNIFLIFGFAKKVKIALEDFNDSAIGGKITGCVGDIKNKANVKI